MKIASNEKRYLKFAWVSICVICLIGHLAGCASNSFSKEALAFVHPGETTRAEVIENFSAPVYDLKDPHVIAYLKDTIAGQAPHEVLHQDLNSRLYQDDPGMAGHSTEVLCFLLDGQDRVVRFGKIVVDGKTQPKEAIRQWARGTGKY